MLEAREHAFGVVVDGREAVRKERSVGATTGGDGGDGVDRRGGDFGQRK